MNVTIHFFTYRSYYRDLFFSGGGKGQKTKEYVEFLAQKVVAVVYEIYLVVTYERVFEMVFDSETKWLFIKWLLMGGGRLREVVAMRELTVFC